MTNLLGGETDPGSQYPADMFARRSKKASQISSLPCIRLFFTIMTVAPVQMFEWPTHTLQVSCFAQRETTVEQNRPVPSNTDLVEYAYVV